MDVSPTLTNSHHRHVTETGTAHDSVLRRKTSHILDALLDPPGPATHVQATTGRNSDQTANANRWPLKVPNQNQESDTISSQASPLGASLLVYPSKSENYSQDNSLASLSSLVQNIVYNSQGKLLKPLSTDMTRNGQEKIQPIPAIQSAYPSPKDPPASQKLQTSHIRFIAPSLSNLSPKPAMVPLFLSPSYNLTTRLPANYTDMALSNSLASTNLLPQTTLAVRQNNSMMLNFSVFKMSQNSVTHLQSVDSSNIRPSNYAKPALKMGDLHPSNLELSGLVENGAVGASSANLKNPSQDIAQSPYNFGESSGASTSPSYKYSLSSKPFDESVNHTKDVQPSWSDGLSSCNKTYPYVSNSFGFIPSSNAQQESINSSSRVDESTEVGEDIHLKSQDTDSQCRFPGQRKIVSTLLVGDNDSDIPPTLRDTHEAKCTISDSGNEHLNHVKWTQDVGAHVPNPESKSSGSTSTQQSPFVTSVPTSKESTPIIHEHPARGNRSSLEQPELLPTKSHDLPEFTNPEKNTDAKSKHGNSRSVHKNTSRGSTCYTCSLVFCSATDLLVHRYEQHSFVCGECDGRFLSESRLQQHKRTDHPPMKKCSRCRFTSFSEESMVKHLWCEHGLKMDDSLHNEGPAEIKTKTPHSTASLPDTSDVAKEPPQVEADHQIDSGRVNKLDHDMPTGRHNCLDKNFTPDASSNCEEQCGNLSPSVNVSLPSELSRVHGVTELSPPCNMVYPRSQRHAPHSNVSTNAYESKHEADLGPVFPSFTRQVPQTSPTSLRNIVDMYSQVNQHCHLDSTEFLSQITSQGTSGHHKTQEKTQGASHVSQAVGGNEGVDSGSLLHSEEPCKMEQADCEPLCLVIHQRHTKDSWKTKSNNHDDRKDVLQQTPRRQTSKAHGGHRRGEDSNFCQSYAPANAKGDNNPTFYPNRKFNDRHARNKRKRKITHRVEMPPYDENAPAKQVGSCKDNLNRKKKFCNQSLIINIDENNMLSLQTKHNCSRDRVKARKKDEIGSSDQSPQITDKAGHDLDMAVGENSQDDLISANYTPSSSDTLDCQQDVPCNSLDTSPSDHFHRRSEQPLYEGTGDFQSSHLETPPLNSRLASLRDRERTRSRSLPPKKRNFTKFNTTRRELNLSDFCKTNYESEKKYCFHQHQQQPHNQQHMQYPLRLQRRQQQQHSQRSLEEESKKRFQCPYEDCQSAFTRKWSMDCHIRKIHKGKFYCEYGGCEQAYLTKTDLRHHMNVEHNGKSRKWKCSWSGCDKVFYTHNHQRIHTLTHTGEKPMACDKCEYRCRQTTALLWHKRRHQQECYQGNRGGIAKSCP